MKTLQKRYFIPALLVLLMVGLLINMSSAAALSSEEIADLSPEEAEAIMGEILEQSDEIMSSTPNVTVATQLLASLPEREDKPAIAVYKIEDKTGQVKDMGASVVTQGATDMMITALERSRQFEVISRAGFNDFMNEQNLQSNDRFAFGEGPELGELTGTDYIIEGAVTEYQVDKSTGGTGLSIGGLGGTSEYARATTAIDVRLVDTTTAEVVWSESLKGEILGEKVGLQAFSFMGDNVVEFETGQGKQEVINMVVRTLLEEAVFKMAESGAI
ncbi:curli production assembly protein CsgG [Halanaerobiaceae bacterium Z-7014]|uniref:Curli production assembly protein CsgG n=1 Tax=Halonatronomonas betaini TaxID=2778430 RepID=A0A931AY72_9FIRM|nr:CsgG/HfaB family protein [Halonatronomonas betaini]MBF8436988.1 curli production assembly protein CsgG [Halonatronomonas betaini]